MKTNTFFIILFMLLFAVVIPMNVYSGENITMNISPDNSPKLENSITVGYLKRNLKKTHPRMILTPSIVRKLKKDVRTNPLVKNYYEAIKLNAAKIQKKPLIKRIITGKRMLSVSRDMLYRMNILGIVYSIDKDPNILKRINEELLAVCNFSDWHPSHYLDVAEMSMAVSLALDWTYNDLPSLTREKIIDALIEKGINSSYKNGMWWLKSSNNWNQVCNGGMVAASIAIAEKDPELAVKTLRRSFNGIPYALKQYMPDGVYPEGATYWGYGTGFSCLTSSLLNTSIGTDFGIAAYPSFIESAIFRKLSISPSGWYFNFSDCGDKESENGDIVLSWFALQTGNPAFLEKKKFLRDPKSMDVLSRFSGAGLVWLSQYKEKESQPLPLLWKGDGPNPVVFFRGGKTNPHDYYFAGKGGRGSVNHGNMDAGSFVFELNGVRWVVDPGTQNYNKLEQAGLDLWSMDQNSQRWTLMTKNNFGHSNITVDNALFNVDGFAPIIKYQTGDQPEAIIDMSEIYKGHLQNAKRKFTKDTDHSIIIEDNVVTTDSTKLLTWAIMTQAEIIPTDNGAILKQDGKQLNLKILSPENVNVSIVMMDPPPIKLDKRIKNFKRVEIRVPAYLFPQKEGTIKVRLSSPYPQR